MHRIPVYASTTSWTLIVSYLKAGVSWSQHSILGSFPQKTFFSTDIKVLHAQRECTQWPNQLNGWKWTPTELWQVTVRPGCGGCGSSTPSSDGINRFGPFSRPRDDQRLPRESCERAKDLKKNLCLCFPRPFEHSHSWILYPTVSVSPLRIMSARICRTWCSFPSLTCL